VIEQMADFNAVVSIAVVARREPRGYRIIEKFRAAFAD
jgi:hypothetical protein